MSNQSELVKRFFEAFSKQADRDFVEELLAPNFTFSAPTDPFLDRKGFFEICWPAGHNLKDVNYVRILECGNEVIVTHEFTKPDGIRGRNTDIITFAGNKITRLEAYFGWDIK
jgi:ketosteroid isomerase-like protein